MDIGPVKLLTYALRLAAVLAFWYLARKRLFAAAVVQSLGYATYGVLIIPIIRSVFAVQIGYLFGAVLLVEALRQGLHRRGLRGTVTLGDCPRSRGAIFVRLVLALFCVSVLSYLVRGAAEYTQPGRMLLERLSREVLPCCIVALIPGQEQLRRCWRVGFWCAAILTSAYLVVSLAALARGGSPSDLRTLPLLGHYLGAGAGIGITLVVMSVYFLPSRRQAGTAGTVTLGDCPPWSLLVFALVSAAALALLAGTRTFAVLVPTVAGLCLLFPPPQRFGHARITIASALVGTALLLPILLSSSPPAQSAFSDQYGFLRERFQGGYGLEMPFRQRTWQRAWALFKQHPLLGGGEANSGIVLTTYDPAIRETISFRMHQHSLYMKYLGEQGFAGSVLLLLIIANFLVSRLHMAQVGRWPAPTAVIGQGAWVMGICGLIRGVAGRAAGLFLGTAFLVAALDTGSQEAFLSRACGAGDHAAGELEVRPTGREEREEVRHTVS